MIGTTLVRVNQVLKWKISQFFDTVCAPEKTQTGFTMVLYFKEREKFEPYGSGLVFSPQALEPSVPSWEHAGWCTFRARP